MTRLSEQRQAPPPVSHLHQHAEDNLRFIRASMESTLSFTGVSGKGYVAGGCSALAASWLAAQQATAALWLSVWMLELVLAASIMLVFTMNKSRNLGTTLFASASGRKLLLAFLPAMSAGAVLTLYFYRLDLHPQLPVLWLNLYGAAIVTAGALSIRAIPLMGLMFMALGAVAAFTPVDPDLLLGLGFGGLHFLFGTYIWSRHGG